VEALGGASARSGEVLGPGHKAPARGIGFPTFAENPGSFADDRRHGLKDWRTAEAPNALTTYICYGRA